jgi:hypothetical protein
MKIKISIEPILIEAALQFFVSSLNSWHTIIKFPLVSALKAEPILNICSPVNEVVNLQTNTSFLVSSS